MAQYVLAVKRDSRGLGLSTQIVAEFPGLTIVGDLNPYIVSVEAEPTSIERFRKRHGSEFLIERAKPRSIPEMPAMFEIGLGGKH